MLVNIIKDQQTGYPLSWDDVKDAEGIYFYEGACKSRLVVIGYGSHIQRFWLHLESGELLTDNESSGRRIRYRRSGEQLQIGVR